MCVDASNKLKRLKLSGLINITGRGLDPLRSSAVIEQIDLSLVKRYEGQWYLQLPLFPSLIVFWASKGTLWNIWSFPWNGRLSRGIVSISFWRVIVSIWTVDHSAVQVALATAIEQTDIDTTEIGSVLMTHRLGYSNTLATLVLKIKTARTGCIFVIIVTNSAVKNVWRQRACESCGSTLVTMIWLSSRGVEVEDCALDAWFKFSWGRWTTSPNLNLHEVLFA